MYVEIDHPGPRTLVLREREEDDAGRRIVTTEHRLEFNEQGVARVSKDTGRYAIEHVSGVREADRSEPAATEED